MSTFKEIIKDHKDYSSQLFKLASSDLKKNYSGAALGWAWAIIRPAIYIFVYWFAIALGLRRGGSVDGYPFFLWLIAGMIPWFYMRDTITSGADAMRKYRYLVTKIKFPISTIPTFVSMSNFIIHILLTVIMIVIFMAFGYMPTVYYLQLPIYMLMMFILFTTWALFSSVLASISKDFLNLVRSLVQALFWLSGILYDASKIDIKWVRMLLKANPVTIICTGYRNSMIHKVWFFEDWKSLVAYLVIELILLRLAVWAYKKFKKDIPDVL